MSTGEETQAIGSDGAQRARIWLEATTRAHVHWKNPERPAIAKLQFEWPTGGTFSYDLGGVLIGGERHGLSFMAESKKYKDAQDQGTHYEKYLAQCYVARTQKPDLTETFLWITWASFWSTKWSTKSTPTTVRDAVIKHHERIFQDADGNPFTKEEIPALVDNGLTQDVSERLWTIVLSDEQEEHLMLSRKHLGLIRQFETEQADA